MALEDVSEMWYMLARFQKAKSVVTIILNILIIFRTEFCQKILQLCIYRCQTERE